MKSAAPFFQVPSRNTIKIAVEKRYERLKSIFQDKLSKVSDFVLTSDIWTETKNTKSFISLTAHFINDGKLRALPLGVEPMSEKHEGPYITELLEKILSFWIISKDQIVSLITDNGSNIVNGAIGLVGKAKYISCFAHTLQLVPEVAFKDEAISALIKKVQRIVTLLKQSVVAADLLRKKQEERTPLKLIQSVETRWNSVYHMIERFLILLPIVNIILLDYPHIIAITGAEAEVLEEMISILKHFASITEDVSGELYVCGSRIIPSIHVLKLHLQKLKLKTDIGKSLLKIVTENLDKRFGQIKESRLLAIATILDPRFKKVHFTDALAAIGALAKINKLMRELKKAKDKSDDESEKTANIKVSEQPDDFWGSS